MKNQNLLTAVVLILTANFLWQLYDIVSMMLQGFFNITFLIRYIPLFLGIAGVILFATSKFKKSNLLMFYMGISLFMYPFSMSLFFKYVMKEPDFYSSQVTMDVMQYVRIGFGFIFFLACCTGLWILSRKRTAKLSYNVIGNETFPEFTAASSGKRFLNRLIDTASYVIIALIFINSGLFGEGLQNTDSSLEFAIIEIPFLILYYLLFESLFHATPGKFITNSIVVNDSGERPAFTQILGRTFSRLIPFDAFTFFGDPSRGWHDSIPNTYVVEAIDADTQNETELLLDLETTQQ